MPSFPLHEARRIEEADAEASNVARDIYPVSMRLQVTLSLRLYQCLVQNRVQRSTRRTFVLCPSRS